ncbi:MAG: hypothetical protein LBF67_08915 [Prevotellaceae bacterium]|jgi:hypothetical protein|nr:hypothetical protein [Prevotellaceae bacterium]
MKIKYTHVFLLDKEHGKPDAKLRRSDVRESCIAVRGDAPKCEPIATYCGWRMFIVNVLYLGIPAEVAMKWTGHSDYDEPAGFAALRVGLR